MSAPRRDANLPFPTRAGSDPRFAGAPALPFR